MSKDFLSTTREGTLLDLKVSLGAKPISVGGPYGEDAIRLKVAAPPASRKSNAEVKRFLAELLRVLRSDLAVARGAASRARRC